MFLNATQLSADEPVHKKRINTNRPSSIIGGMNSRAFDVTCVFPPPLIRFPCSCIHVSDFPAIFSLFSSSLCLICCFLPAIAKLKQPFSLAGAPSLPLPVPLLLISTLQICFLWWTPIIQPPPTPLHTHFFSQSDFSSPSVLERIYPRCCALDRKKRIFPPARYFLYNRHNNHNPGTSWKISISSERMKRRKECVDNS